MAEPSRQGDLTPLGAAHVERWRNLRHLQGRIEEVTPDSMRRRDPARSNLTYGEWVEWVGGNR